MNFAVSEDYGRCFFMREIHISMNHTPSLTEAITACIGYFDGIHQGHQRLIETVVNYAKADGSVPALITFDPDPWEVIKKQHDLSHLMSMEERKQTAASLGIEYWIILDFTAEMAALSVEQFHERILYPLALQHLICGYDFHYAHEGKGNTETLRAQQRFLVVVIDEISNEHQKISSTRIEALIHSGDMEKAAELLTRPYAMSGVIEHGLKNGRRIGFPTANLRPVTHYVLPKEGVYAGIVTVKDKDYPAMINVGKNPTLDDHNRCTIEAHLMNFSGDLYDQPVRFHFYHYIRAEIKFSDLNALKQQLTCDRQAALAYFHHRKER